MDLGEAVVGGVSSFSGRALCYGRKTQSYICVYNFQQETVVQKKVRG